MSCSWVIIFFKSNTQGSSCLFSWFWFNGFPAWTKWVYNGMCVSGIWDRAWVQFPRYRAYTASHLTLNLQLFWEYMMKMGLTAEDWPVSYGIRISFFQYLKCLHSSSGYFNKVLTFTKTWKFPVHVEYVGIYWYLGEAVPDKKCECFYCGSCKEKIENSISAEHYQLEGKWFPCNFLNRSLIILKTVACGKSCDILLLLG